MPRASTPPPTPRRTQAERRAATREQLIRTAVALVQTRGLASASLHEVARQAGLTTGALQHHFPSKAALMMEVLSALVAQDDHVGGLWPDPAAPLAERARHFVQAAWALIYSQPRFAAAWNVYLGSRDQPEVLAHLAGQRQAVGARMLDGLARSFPELAAAPDREAFAALLLSSLRGLGLLQIFPAPDPGLDAPAGQLDCLAQLIELRCRAAAPTETPA